MANRGIGNSLEVRKKLSYDHELITTCYHEAGHTISSLLNFSIVSSVGTEISKDKRSGKDLGFTNFECVLEVDVVKNKELLNKLLISEIHINYAGLAAEKIFYKDICGTDKLPMVLKHGSYMDRDRVSDIIKKYDLAPPGKKRHLYKKKLFLESQKAIENFWDDVKLVARNLFNRKKIYYSDLQQILVKKSRNKIFWKQRFKDISIIFEASKTNDEAFIIDILKN